MAKGMSLAELRAALSSDATVENDGLKLELKNVKEKASSEIRKYKDEAEKYKELFGRLAKRCLTLTGGTMCLHCEISSCPHALNNNDWDAICHLMERNHMARTPETALAVSEYIQGRQLRKLRKGA